MTEPTEGRERRTDNDGPESWTNTAVVEPDEIDWRGYTLPPRDCPTCGCGGFDSTGNRR